MPSPSVSPGRLTWLISPPTPELDPFGDLFPSGRQDGAKSFDLSNLADSLPESGKERKDCKTPEAFLGPAASSLVNLDSLVAPAPASKTRNPFLSGRCRRCGGGCRLGGWSLGWAEGCLGEEEEGLEGWHGCPDAFPSSPRQV